MQTVCVKLFKTATLILRLVNFGMGYAKFYVLLKSTFESLTDVDVTSDLRWIPTLVVQVCNTLLLVAQVFCLVRELCIENYMYKHCFKFCYTLTILIYCLTVVPNSFMNVIYHSYDVTDRTWWTIVTDIFDSLLAMLSALGFQLILFLVIIQRTCVSAGACKSRRINPLNENGGNDVTGDIIANPSACCCFPRNNGAQEDETDQTRNANSAISSSNTEITSIDDSLPQRAVPVAKSKQIFGAQGDETDQTRNANSAISSPNTEITSIDESLPQRAVPVAKAKQIFGKFKQMEENLNKRIEKSKNRIESKLKSVTESDKLGNKAKSSKIFVIKNAIEEAKEKVGTKLTDRVEGNAVGRVCCTGMRSGKKLLCSCAEDRTICFIISLSLASIHMMVFVIELVIVACFVC